MKRRTTRADIASFARVYRDLWQQTKETFGNLWQLLLFIALVPVHHLLWLWLPQLSEQLRVQREHQAKEWADADL